VSRRKAGFLPQKLGFENMFVVDSQGKSGSLILLRNSVSSVEIQNFSCRHINAIIKLRSGETSWKFSGFYGHPDASKRMQAWSLLRHLSNLDPVPWLCSKDFNEITSMGEKSSSSIRPRRQMDDFKRVLDDCQLGDLGFCGPKFTWSNGRSGEDITRERLDRALANHQWCQLFNVVDVEVLYRCSSDHHPLLISFSNSTDIQWRKCRSFHYEASWAKNKGSMEAIKNVWRPRGNSGSVWSNVRHNLSSCRRVLQQWVRKDHNKGELAVQEKSKELLAIQL
jgi:hypothetical protein